MANNTYIGINPNSLVRTESGELSLYVNGAPVAFFSSSADIVFSGSLGIDGVSDISASLAGMISGVSASNGLLGGGPSGVISLSLDTGSIHFIEGVLKSGVFRQTGSIYATTNDLEITGSLVITNTISALDIVIDNWDSVSSSLARLNSDRVTLESAFTNYTSSTDLRINSLEAATSSYLQASDLSSLNTFTGSALLRFNSLEAATGSYVVNSQTGSFLVTGSVSENTITLEKADGSSFTLDVASSIFRQTGSIYATTNDIEVSGSLEVNFLENDQEFRISSQSITQFKINNDGIAVFTAQSIEPTFVSGGMYYSNTGAFYLGTTD